MIMDRKRVLVACGILGLAGIFGHWMSMAQPLPETSSRVSLPFVRDGWEGNPYDIAGLLAPNVGTTITRQYRFRGGAPVNLLVLERQRGHPPSACYQAIGWRVADEADLVSPSGAYRMSGLLGQNDGANEILIYSGVHVGGRIVKDGILLKYEEVKQRLARWGEAQHHIEVTLLFPVGQKSRAKAYLAKFMDEMGDLLPGVDANE